VLRITKAGVFYATYGHWTLSLLQAGYEVAWQVQPDIKHSSGWDKLATVLLQTNFPGIDYGIKGEADIIVGSPPCIGFSQGNPDAGPNHWANKNFVKCFEKIAILRPKYFLVEMVPRIFKIGVEFLDDALDAVNEYHINSKIFEIADYGTPARRNRVYFFGSLEDVGNPLEKLPTKERVGCSTVLDNYKQFNDFKPDSRLMLSIYKADGHTLRKGPFGAALQKSRILKRDEPAFTITGMAHTNMIHYAKHRFLAIPEIADLMGFPEDFKYIKKSIGIVTRIIASGVDVRFTTYLLKFLRENYFER